jgi:hypothetical protein
MTYASVAASAGVDVYANWGQNNGENDLRLSGRRSLDRRSKQDTSRRGRTRIYSIGFVVHESIIAI